MEGHLVFAYGTLRQGDCRYGLTSLIKLVHEEAYLKGFDLLNLGPFPGVVHGTRVVRGEVHLYSTYDELDQIEGYREDKPEASMYIRKNVIVEGPTGQEVQAAVYVFNADPNRRYHVIESGDWLNK